MQFSKVTKSWSSKPIKKQKDKIFLHQMVKETVEYSFKNEHPKKPVILNLPKNIASTPKPEKSIIVQNHLSRFGNKN